MRSLSKVSVACAVLTLALGCGGNVLVDGNGSDAHTAASTSNTSSSATGAVAGDVASSSVGQMASAGSGGSTQTSPMTTTSTLTTGGAGGAMGASSSTSTGPQGCTGDLSGLGTGDFRISFDVTTTQARGDVQGLVALTNQRSFCGHSIFWDIRMAAGMLEVETDDGVGGYTELIGTHLLNDGVQHHVVEQRVAGVLSLTVDGADDGSAQSLSSFGNLAAPLAIGTDICEMTDGTQPFVGTISPPCVEPLPVHP
jgi:Laminin G domain